jgi:hypothetical protein
MSTESTFVANVKTSKGTILTVRGDDITSFSKNISDAVAGQIDIVIGALEDSMSPMSISEIVNAVGGTVTAINVAAPNTPSPSCKHGTRKHKAGASAKGPWQAWMCPSAKGTSDQCEPIWIKRGEPGWV